MEYLTLLKNFLDEENRLKAFPSKRKLQLCAVSYLAEKFEPGRIYTEREVNIIIADYNDDFCTIRRDMISERLMERDERGYRRTEL